MHWMIVRMPLIWMKQISRHIFVKVQLYTIKVLKKKHWKHLLVDWKSIVRSFYCIQSFHSILLADNDQLNVWKAKCEKELEGLISLLMEKKKIIEWLFCYRKQTTSTTTTCKNQVWLHWIFILIYRWFFSLDIRSIKPTVLLLFKFQLKVLKKNKFKFKQLIQQYVDWFINLISIIDYFM